MLDMKSFLVAKSIYQGSGSGESGGNESGGDSGETKTGLNYDSWETISQRSMDGTAQEHYNVGDTKCVEFTVNGVKKYATFCIAGFNIHEDENGVKSGITFIQCSDFYYNHGVSYSTLSDDLKAVIKPTKITSKKWKSGSVEDYEYIANNVFAPFVSNFPNTMVDVEVASCKLYEPEGVAVFPVFEGKTVSDVCKMLGLYNDERYTCLGAYEYKWKTTSTVEQATGPYIRPKSTVFYYHGFAQNQIDHAFNIYCFRI